ncbi:MAG: diaminopimelate epimerase [Oscillospiraceae bacterium]
MNHTYCKYHGLGNDYIVIDPAACGIPMTEDAVRHICDRNFGAGSDGILYGPLFENGAPRVVIFNPDGSRAEKSGNGVRIFARYLKDAGYVTDSTFSLITDGGVVRAEYLDAAGGLIRVNMGKPTFISEEIPVAGARREVVDEPLLVLGEEFHVTCVSVGNPHCVIPMEKAEKALALRIGAAVEHHAMFPNRINMQLLEVIDRANIKIEIWERGASYTLASGSSSCAAACAAHKLGLTDAAMTVHMPGGEIRVELLPDGRILMTGAVKSVYTGVFSEEFYGS